MEKNKRYSYDAGYKLKVIAYAEKHGNRATERHFGPPPTEKTIRDWRANKEELKKMRKTKCANRGLNAKWPKLEDDVLKWIQGQRQNGIEINTKMIQIHARKLALQWNLTDFNGGVGWCYRFMKRQCDNIKITNMGQSNDEDSSDNEVPLARLINLNQIRKSLCRNDNGNEKKDAGYEKSMKKIKRVKKSHRCKKKEMTVIESSEIVIIKQEPEELLQEEFSIENVNVKDELLTETYDITGSNFTNDITKLEELNYYKCPKCERQYETVKKFESHSCQEHDDSLNYDCSKYVRRIDGRKFYNCDECSYITTHVNNFRTHRRMHTGHKPFACNLCDYRSAQKFHLVQHQMVHTGEKPYSCDMCSYRSKGKSELKKHKKSHQAKNILTCKTCEYRCTRVHQLRLHELQHEGTGDRFKCSECSYTTLKVALYYKHKRMHRLAKTYTCDECTFTCQQFGKFKNHKRLHVDGKPYVCEECAQTFSLVTDFQKHREGHTLRKLYICGDCNYTSYKSGHFTIHRKIHTKERPYSCDMCDYSATQIGHLTAHKRTHTGDKPYACGICEYRSTQQQHIKLHRLIHTGEKPFACDLCPFMCRASNELKRHKVRHDQRAGLVSRPKIKRVKKKIKNVIPEQNFKIPEQNFKTPEQNFKIPEQNLNIPVKNVKIPEQIIPIEIPVHREEVLKVEIQQREIKIETQEQQIKIEIHEQPVKIERDDTVEQDGGVDQGGDFDMDKVVVKVEPYEQRHKIKLENKIDAVVKMLNDRIELKIGRSDNQM